jgi:hypothetical protein
MSGVFEMPGSGPGMVVQDRGPRRAVGVPGAGRMAAGVRLVGWRNGVTGMGCTTGPQ